MDPRAVSLLVRFPTIHKEHFSDILHNRFKPETILKLSTSFTSFKSRVKCAKVGERIELAIREDDSLVTEAKSVTQLLRCCLLYGQIILHFAPVMVQFDLESGLAAYVDQLLGHSMLYSWETVCLFHFHFHRARIAIGVYDPEGWKTQSTDLELFCLLRKPLLYTNFTSWSAPTSYFGSPTAGENPYSSNHNYAAGNYQGSNSGRNMGSSGTPSHNNQQKQGDGTPLVCCNFKNGKDCPPTYQYKHQCSHCASAYPARDCPSSAAASGSNSLPVRSR